MKNQLLIAESDADLREALGEVLREGGHEATEAGTLDEARRRLAAMPRPGVILLGDIPDRDELRRHVQQTREARLVELGAEP